MNFDILELAKEVLKLNEQFNPAIGGSICLKLNGIDLDRDPHDIDIVFDQPILNLPIQVPTGWFQYNGKTSDMVIFKNDNVDINIDFMYSPNGTKPIINGIKCDAIENIVVAKKLYISKNSYSSKKHLLDIKKINEWLQNVK